MSDVIDKAQHQSELMLAQAIKNTQRHAINATKGVSAKICVTCGEPIPKLRRKQVAGCTRCTACQSEIENKAKKARGH